MTAIATMSDNAIGKVRSLENLTLTLPQVPIPTGHQFHAGVYARTICIPAGVLLTGALIKIPTVLIVSGDVVMYGGGGGTRVTGYRVLEAAAHRKMAFAAEADTYLTMIFATDATTVEDAEREFTDEAHLLFSRRDENRERLICLEE